MIKFLLNFCFVLSIRLPLNETALLVPFEYFDYTFEFDDGTIGKLKSMCCSGVKYDKVILPMSPVCLIITRSNYVYPYKL